MSQPKPKISEVDFGGVPMTKDRGMPSSVVNLPSDVLDPTREIRGLIEGLQQGARDARAQLRAAEEERDAVAEQLAIARRQNDELRAHFVEITSLIRERDAAVQEAERQARAVREAQAQGASAQAQLASLLRERGDAGRQRDEISKQRDELARERDDLRRRVDAAARATQEAISRRDEVQRQLFSIRQARDTAQAQKMEVMRELSAAQDQIAELRYQVESQDKAAVSAGETAALRSRLDQIAAEREQTKAEREQIAAERDAALRQSEELTGALDQALGELEELRAHSLARVDVTPELEQLRAQAAALAQEREAAEVQAQVLSREVLDLRQQLGAQAEQVGALSNHIDELTRYTEQVQHSYDMLARERDAAQRGREEVLTSLSAAQKQIERIIRDRDLARQQSTENALALEAQIEALRSQLGSNGSGAPDANARTSEIRQLAQLLEVKELERRDLAARLEEQRVETIDLAARLQAAQEQMKTVSAQLAEARLQGKLGGQRPAFAPGGRPLPPRGMETIPGPFSATPSANFDVDVLEALSSMRRCFQSFTQSPGELSHMKELHAQAQAFAEQARTRGLVPVHRLSSAFAGLVHELYLYPEQVNPTILRTVSQTIEFLATLSRLPNLQNAKDPATATVYAVDDDVDNSQCIKMALETAMMRTTCVHDPVVALQELASTSCDLIFLDVNLPGMDGFELCTAIRQMERHRTTPVIFLTGLSTPENRAQSGMSGGNDFVGKPFILCELTVKALTQVLKAQLHMA